MSQGYLKTKRRTAKYLAQHTKTPKTSHKKSNKNTQNQPQFFIASVFIYPDSESVFVTGTPDTGDTKETENKTRKNQKNVCLLQPPSKVTNRHYSFGLTKISTLPKAKAGQGPWATGRNQFWKRTGKQLCQAVPLFRGTPAVRKYFSVVYFCK